MADPLSILGAAVGLTSLVIQVVDECIKGYHFYCKLVDMPAKYQYLIIRIQMEQRRFLSFSQEAGLLWVEQRLCDTLQVNQTLLLGILAEIKLSFEQSQKQLAKYTKYLSKDKVTPQNEPQVDLGDVLFLSELRLDDEKGKKTDSKIKDSKHLGRWKQTITTTGKNLRDIAVDPRRLTFTFIDEPLIERLIARLSELNSFLIVLLDESQTERLRVVVNNSYREILQVREDIQTLQRLVEALDVPKDSGKSDDEETLYADSFTSLVHKEADVQFQETAYLKRLAQIKLQHKLALTTTDIISMSNIQPMNFKLFSSVKELTAGRSSARYAGHRMYIEWQNTETLAAQNVKKTEDLLKLLTDLLVNQKPKQFRLPPCLGFVRRESMAGDVQFGIVFENPNERAHTRLRTLTELLSEPMPSLTERIKLCTVLAECIYEFHTVGWLHKGIRSNNIVFFVEESRAANLASPYLLGFHLSRPDMLDELSLKPNFVAAEEIYRHPQAQFSARGSRYRSSYDLYSLAIVMLEIAVWKPIQDILGFRDLNLINTKSLQKLKEQLISNDQYLHSVACAAGTPFKNVIESCLLADELEKPLNKDQDGTMMTEIRLQRTFGQDVVGKLQRLSRILEDG